VERQNIYSSRSESEKKKPVELVATTLSTENKSASSLWDKIINFVKALLQIDDAAKNRKLLKDVEYKLLSFSIPVYEPKGKMVRKEFIKSLIAVQQGVDEFAEFFNANFFVTHSDYVADKHPSFSRYMIESLMTMDQLAILREMKMKNVVKSIELKGEKAAAREIEGKINELLSLFNASTTERIEREIAIFMGVINLKNYDFKTLLAFFFQEEEGKMDAHAFHDYSLEILLPHLKRLDEYFEGISFNSLKEEHYQWFEKFKERFSPDDFADSGVGTYSVADFKKLLGLLRKIKKKNVIRNLVKIGMEDIDYRSKPIINAISYVEKYKNFIKKIINEHAASAITEYRELVVEKLVEELFAKFSNYLEYAASSNQINTSIKNRGGLGFKNNFSFTLIMNFMKNIYNNGYKKSLNYIAAEGEFHEKESRDDFSDSYFGIEEAFNSATDLESRLSEDSEIYVKIMTFINGEMTNPIAVKRLEEEIGSLDFAMGEFAEIIASKLIHLKGHLEKINRDFKGIHGYYLSNPGAIGGLSNGSLQNKYEEFFNYLTKLEKIVSKFIVLK